LGFLFEALDLDFLLQVIPLKIKLLEFVAKDAVNLRIAFTRNPTVDHECASLSASIPPSRVIESVATILESSIESTIDAWYKRVKKDKMMTTVSMSREGRVGHLPKILIDMVHRLRSFKSLGSHELTSVAAQQHGRLRRQQGYSAAMMVEESRMLQVSIFETLQKKSGVHRFQHSFECSYDHRG
jgi:hypothetical protein